MPLRAAARTIVAICNLKAMSMRALPQLFCSLIFSLLTGAAIAADAPPHYNQIHLQAQSSQPVENDRMQAMLSTFGEGTDSAKLADELNHTMSWALSAAKKYPLVRVNSGPYQTYPVLGKTSLKQWRSSQEITLEADNTAQMVQLIGVLQQHLQVNTIQFSVSPATRSKAEDQLIDKALAAFQARADRIRRDLGAKSYRIVDLTIGTAGNGVAPYPMLRQQAMESSVAAPAVESGSSVLSVTAEGTIELQQ